MQRGQGRARVSRRSRNCSGRSICCRRSARRRSFRCGPTSATSRPARAFRRSSIVSRASARSPAFRRRLLEHPKAAWLVLACDLPFLTERTLQHLIAHRDPQQASRPRIAALTTACPSRCARSGSPRAREPLLALHRERQAVPAQVPDQRRHRAARSARARALDNVNTARGVRAAVAAIGERCVRSVDEARR